MIWIVMAPFLVMAMFVAAGHWMTTQTIASRQNYQAVLRPQSTPVAIVLPQGAHLASIVVSEGEIVRPGQTLARLDAAAAEATWVTLEQDLVAARYARHCLLHQTEEPFLESVESWLLQASDNPEMVARIQTAHALCKADREETEAQEHSLSSALRVLTERDALLAQAINALGKGETTQTEHAIHKGVQLLLAQNDTRARIATTRDQLARLQIERERNRAERLVAVNDEISSLLAARSHADNVRGRSILTAETGGIVTRVRNPGAGHYAKQALTILDISRSERPTFALELVDDQLGLDRLQVGFPVEVRLSWPGQTETFEGTLVAQETRPGSAPQVGFGVELTQEAQKALRKATGTLVNSGVATTAEAQVNIGLLPAPQIFDRAAREIWRSSYVARVRKQAGKKMAEPGPQAELTIGPDI